MCRSIKLAMTILIAIGGTGVALSNWAGNHRAIAEMIDQSAFNFHDNATGTTGLDWFTRQFADYRGDLTNPFTFSTRPTGFNTPTNNVQLVVWANSMTASYNSQAPRGWPIYHVPAVATDWAANMPTKDAPRLDTVVSSRAP